MQREHEQEFTTVISGTDTWAAPVIEKWLTSWQGEAVACILGGAFWAFGFWALRALIGGGK